MSLEEAIAIARKHRDQLAAAAELLRTWARGADDEAYAELQSRIGRTVQQLMHFYATLKEGDVVVAADGATALGIGRVAGPYRYEAGADFAHQRPVEWLDIGEWKLPEPEGLQSTVRELRKYPVNLVELERRLTAGSVLLPPPPPEPRQKQVPSLSGVLGDIQRALERKGQVILYGRTSRNGEDLLGRGRCEGAGRPSCL